MIYLQSILYRSFSVMGQPMSRAANIPLQVRPMKNALQYYLKGKVARDFRPSVFFINQPHIRYVSD
jgi:hypothetical protein